jgi:copper chaperone CopZ
MSPYLLHVLDGRLRIKVPEVKRAPLKAAEVTHALQRLHGITYAHANPTTGNVLVFFEPRTVGPRQIEQALRDIGCLTDSGSVAPAGITRKGVGQKLAETLVQSVFEMAVQRAITTLI